MKYILIPIGKLIMFLFMIITATFVYIFHFLYEILWNFRIEPFGVTPENGSNLSYYPFNKHIDKNKMNGYVYIFKSFYATIFGFKPLTYFDYDLFHLQEYLHISKYIGKKYYYMVFKKDGLYKVDRLFKNGGYELSEDGIENKTFESIKEVQLYLNIINGAVCKEFFYKLNY